ncbi:GYDIA family GHMP kinase [Maribacter polysiphoniae]|uniref:GYDIA family GHMP kinase n=1 Tax=Maribacter polysiphoniae TaxID=429344 RepID=UPI002357DCC8|nr:GYDIA family GHMP kinase [Maribacter polysiphoniae]
MRQEFYSNGKLLLTGEYAVLDGAKALALPTKYGQVLTVEPTQTKIISWKSLDKDGKVWFTAEFHSETMEEISSTDAKISKTALEILVETKHLRPDFLTTGEGFNLTTQLTFPKDWGLGSSSTLINNIAQWAHIDPYRLLENTFGGSGYDIACAQHNTPITYQLDEVSPLVEKVDFNPSFKTQLFFVYLNKKQNSREGISDYRSRTFNKNELVRVIGDLTSKIVGCTDITTFETLLDLHESVISQTLQTPSVKQELFPDYPRSIKSLGAWGGDFILAVGDPNLMRYFSKKGYHTIVPYSEMIL